MKTLHELIASAQRELTLRRIVYPARIAQRKMEESKARHEIECMEHILDTLEQLRDGKAPCFIASEPYPYGV